MNDPKKLNGWTGPMMLTLRDRFVQHAKDDNTKVLILTGADPYYCAGVNLSATIQPMHPREDPPEFLNYIIALFIFLPSG